MSFQSVKRRRIAQRIIDIVHAIEPQARILLQVYNQNLDRYNFIVSEITTQSNLAAQYTADAATAAQLSADEFAAYQANLDSAYSASDSASFASLMTQALDHRDVFIQSAAQSVEFTDWAAEAIQRSGDATVRAPEMIPILHDNLASAVNVDEEALTRILVQVNKLPGANMAARIAVLDSVLVLISDLTVSDIQTKLSNLKTITDGFSDIYVNTVGTELEKLAAVAAAIQSALSGPEVDEQIPIPGTYTPTLPRS